MNAIRNVSLFCVCPKLCVFVASNYDKMNIVRKIRHSVDDIPKSTSLRNEPLIKYKDRIGVHANTLSEYRRVLTPNGKLIIVGGPSDNPWLGPLTTLVKAYFVSPFVSQKQLFMLAQSNGEDLDVLRDLMQTGKLTPVIDRRYPLSETAQAISYLEQGHAKGKVIITVDQ